MQCVYVWCNVRSSVEHCVQSTQDVVCKGSCRCSWRMSSRAPRSVTEASIVNSGLVVRMLRRDRPLPWNVTSLASWCPCMVWITPHEEYAWYNCAPVVFLIRWDLLLGALGRRCVDGNGAVQIVVLDFAQLSLQDTSYGGPARLWWWRQGVSSVMLRTRPVVAAFRWVLLLVVTRSRMNLESALTCAQVAIRNFSSAWTLSAVAKAFASARSGASCACPIGIPNIAPASGSVTTGHQCIGPHHA